MKTPDIMAKGYDKEQGKKGTFGSTEKRFAKLNYEEETPGPGRYRVEKAKDNI
jgi:hypothetical protein